MKVRYKKINGIKQYYDYRGGFKVRVTALKKNGAQNLWGITCEKSQFYAQKSYFFQF